MQNAVNWFEIPSVDLARAQSFYETVLDCTMRREPMGPSEGAVFPYAEGRVGGAVLAGPTAAKPGADGTLIYLNAAPSLDAALTRTVSAGGQIALPRQSLPPGMGFFAHIIDLDGNRVGLHALA